MIQYCWCGCWCLVLFVMAMKNGNETFVAARLTRIILTRLAANSLYFVILVACRLNLQPLYVRNAIINSNYLIDIWLTSKHVFNAFGVCSDQKRTGAIPFWRVHLPTSLKWFQSWKKFSILVSSPGIWNKKRKYEVFCREPAKKVKVRLTDFGLWIASRDNKDEPSNWCFSV